MTGWEIGSIDPVAALLALATLGVAVVALGVGSKRADTAIVKVVLQFLMIVSGILAIAGLIAFAAAASGKPAEAGNTAPLGGSTAGPTTEPIPSPTIRTTEPPETFTSSPVSSTEPGDGENTIGTPPGGAGQNATTASTKIDLEIITIEYRRKNLEGTTYSVYPGTGDLDFRFGWTSHTDNGPLETDDCVVNARISRASGEVLKSSPSNECSQGVGPYSYRAVLEPGSYIVEVRLERAGSEPLLERKAITIEAA